MTLLREYVTCLKALLAGRTVTYKGTYVSLTNVALEWAPPGSCELLLAAGGHKTLRLSGELADGTVLTSGTSASNVRAAIKHVNDGRRRAGRDPQEHAIVTYIPCAMGPSAEHDIARELTLWGFPASPDLHASGDAETIAHSLDQWVEAGSDTVVLQSPPDVALEDFLGYAGTYVKPRIGTNPRSTT